MDTLGEYEDLIDWIAKSDICLGIFSTSEKASRDPEQGISGDLGWKALDHTRFAGGT